MKSNQAGFSLLTSILVIAVIGMILFLGIRVYESHLTVPESAETKSAYGTPAANGLDSSVVE